MIRLRFDPTEPARPRFGYSPLAEVVESLCILQSAVVPELHQIWFDRIRTRLRRADMGVVRAILPPHRSRIPGFLIAAAREPSVSIDAQLARVADRSTARLRRDLDLAWRGDLPRATTRLLEHGSGARIADALWRYWTAAVRPFWPQMREILDADIAYRTSRLDAGGMRSLLLDLHPDLELVDGTIRIPDRTVDVERHLNGTGLLLVPCIFLGPHVAAELSRRDPPNIRYSPRGIDARWPATGLAVRPAAG